MTTVLAARRVKAGARATYSVYAGLGLSGSTWASRLPQVSTRLHLDPATLGLLLLVIAAGGVVVLPLSGPLVARIGPRRAITAMALLVGVSLGAVALGYALPRLPILVGGLYLLGTATGVWDVAMAVHAAAVERELGRSIMPRFFAAFSLGTVAGASLGVVMVAWHVPVPVHLAAIAAVVATGTPAAARHFLPETACVATKPAAPIRHRSRLAGWQERRTVVVGLTAAAFAVAEGAGSNWISISVIDSHRVSTTVGGLAYAAFLVALTAGRWSGPLIVDRFGRVASLRAAATVAAGGLVLFGLGPDLATAFAGTLLWGAGAALGFPVSMSAAADDPGHAADRVGVITSIGYGGFLGGPPLIGFVGHHTSIGRALLIVAVLLGTSVPLASAAGRPLTDAAGPTRSASETTQGDLPCPTPSR
ncbi:MAG TPA: MFS transporter [Trebonia sp.]